MTSLDFLMAIDPGDTMSAAIWYDCARKAPAADLYCSNSQMRDAIASRALEVRDDSLSAVMVVEYTPPYTLTTQRGGTYVPKQVVDTAIQIGRFLQVWESYGFVCSLVSRLDVKKHLLGRANGTDQLVNAALFERYGGGIKQAKGTKKAPGPLYGFNGHLYAALAVAVTYCETQELLANVS